MTVHQFFCILHLSVCCNDLLLFPLTMKTLYDLFNDIIMNAEVKLPVPKTGIKDDNSAALRKIIS